MFDLNSASGANTANDSYDREIIKQILRNQPKSSFAWDKKKRKHGLEKTDRIDYDRLWPLHEIDEMSALTKLKQSKRYDWRRQADQFLPPSWADFGFKQAEDQEIFDEAVYEQQLTQRVGRGILTQKPRLEWVTLQEASNIFQVNYKVVNRWIREDNLNTLQFKKGHRKLIRLNKRFYDTLMNSRKSSFNEYLMAALEMIAKFGFEPKTERYRHWKLPITDIERLFPSNFTDKQMRSAVVRPGEEAINGDLRREVDEGELKKYQMPYTEFDSIYFDAILARSKAINFGLPPLRYFTTEEAAFYLRLSKLAILKAVDSGRLTPLKTTTGKHFIFEKKDILKFIGPSTDPIHVDEQDKKIFEWVQCEYGDEFSGTVPGNSKSRYFLSKEDKLIEKRKIVKAFNILTEVSFIYRVDNLGCYYQFFYSDVPLPPLSRACMLIQRYNPKKVVRKKKVVKKIKVAINS